MLENDPLWYKDAVIYELHVRSFLDSTGDGVGDFPGLTSRLDYIRDLGVTAVWLLPFYPSPLRDDGYDIADYTGIHPMYGTLRDFKTFLREAHRRGLRVITELVVNHTSDQHPWFQRARRAPPGSSHRNFYVWSDTPDRYRDARIIFKDFETSNWSWDPVAKAYYWHRFYAHQPDLNYDNPAVRRAIFRAVDFWFGLGVDGLRLDAVPYLYEREGTSCENLPETHAFLRQLRAHVDRAYKNRMLLAEANQWPEDAAAYFGQGDECHMAFHFPVMPRLFMALHMEDRFPLVEILQQTPPIPASSQWAVFLRNHDELTLEMVTDEERDYMVRVYASDPRMRINFGIRRRLAPLLGNHRRSIELLNGILFSLPGTPVLYYGDEIGMGDNIYLGDRDAVRTPMQWSADRNAGFSQANPQRLFLPVSIDPEYHYEAVNVETQQNNPRSLLWWMKRMIATNKSFKAFGRGTMEFLHPENRKVLAFLRRHQDERILVVANLSRFTQCVELDLGEFRGLRPVEVFGRTEFPPVGPAPYFLSLGPHAFHWFTLEAPKAVELQPGAGDLPLPVIEAAGPWTGILQGKTRAPIRPHLPALLLRRRWFGGKARPIRAVDILEAIPFPPNSAAPAVLTLLQVHYGSGASETYALPLRFVPGGEAAGSPAALARLRLRDGEAVHEGILCDALWDPAFAAALLETIRKGRGGKEPPAAVSAWSSRAFRDWPAPEAPLDPAVLRGEQSNTSVSFGGRLVLKFIRRLEEGVNPDLEIGRFLTERRAFPHIPPLAGALTVRWKGGGPATLALLHGYVRNEGDAWRYTLDALGHFFEKVLSLPAPPDDPLYRKPLMDLAAADLPPLAGERIGPYLDAARQIGSRTAELHLALVGDPDDPDFAPEPFTDFYRQGIYHAMSSLASRNLQLLRQRLKALPEPAQKEARQVLALEGELRRLFRPIRDRRIGALRIRCHGDYHLGQLLYTGKDFVILDFEGEPSRSLGERRIKRSPLRDVAGMIRSFHYASCAALCGQVAGVRPEDGAVVEAWSRFWFACVSAAFLRAYRAAAGAAPFLPGDDAELRILLDAYLLEKAFYELGYELNNRPDWVRIPMQGILQRVESAR